MSKSGPSKDDVKNTKEMNNLFESMQNITGDITRNLESIKEEEAAILSTQNRGVKLAQLTRQLQKEKEKLSKNENNLSKEQVLLKRKDLGLATQRLKSAKQMQAGNIKIRNQLVGVNDQAQKLSGHIENFVSALPGGKSLIKMFGIDQIGVKFEESLNKGAEVLKSGGSIKEAMTAFGGGLKGMLGPAGILLVIIGGLVAAFSIISKKAQEFSKETGITFGQARKLGKEASDMTISLDDNLSSTKDIKDVLSASIKEFGVLNMLSAEQAMNVSEIGQAFGYGAAQAGKVNNVFMQMGASAESAADAQRDLAAEALKSGLNVGAVTKDIADNAKLTSKFFGGNVKALKKAALQAAKLGMSIATMAKVSESLLNFEDSISSQYEFQALTGKQLNLDTARQLALQGDIAGATKLIMDQVGSSADLAAMNVIERKALAKATGMEFDQLQKSAIIKEKMKDLTAEDAAAMANLGLSAAEMAGMSSEQLQNKLAEQQANKRNSQSFAAMGNILINAIMPAAQAISELFGALAPIIKMAFFPLTAAAMAFASISNFIKDSVIATTAFGVALGAILLMKKTSLGISRAEAIVIGLRNAKEKIGLNIVAMRTSMEKKGFFKTLASAALTAFKSVAATPFIGPILGAAAAASVVGLGASLISKTGDLGIDPNGGPIVSSPRVGGIFQGAKADGVSMGPGMGTDPSTGSTNGGGSVSIDYQRMAQAIVKAMAGVTVQSAPIQIGAQVINAISDQIDVNKSYN